MRPVRAIQIFVLSIGLVGCTRAAFEPTPAPADDTARAAPGSISLTCTPPLHDCLACNGAHLCARQCPACPPLVSPVPEPGAPSGSADAPSVADLVCRPPLRRCIDCRGTPFCGRQCPECAPTLAPATDEPASVAGLTPVLESCGAVVCAPGLHCCNASCSLCTPKGVSCTQQSCD